MGGAPMLHGGRPVKRAIADLGPAPGGATNARFVATSDWTEYIVKAVSLCGATAPYVPSNELIAAELAALLDIPVLPWQLIELPGGEVAWGSLRIDTADFARMGSSVALALDDRSLFSAVAVFDLWIGNTDRHAGNLLGKRAHQGPGYALLANDHSHALIRELISPSGLDVFYEARRPNEFWRCAELIEGVSDCPRLRNTIDRIESMPDSVIGTVVAGVPSMWMDDTVKAFVIDFLVRRAGGIRALMQSHIGFFPRAAGVTL